MKRLRSTRALEPTAAPLCSSRVAGFGDALWLSGGHGRYNGGAAVAQLGSFDNIYGPMKMRRILKWPVIGVVALLTALLGFIGYDVFATVLPDTGIVVTASDGAHLRVDGRALTVFAGSAGSTSFAPLLRPVTAGIFSVLAIFALIGAASLFRDDRQARQIVEPDGPANGSLPVVY